MHFTENVNHISMTFNDSISILEDNLNEDSN